MTYFDFLFIFLFPPIAALFIFFYRSQGIEKPRKKHFVEAIALLCALAFIYTTPWDNYLVATNVWSYGEDKVALVIGWVPLEEYLFFFLQTILTGLWCFSASSIFGFKNSFVGNSSPKTLFTLFSIAETAAVMALFNTSTRYLGLILAWCLPVIFLQLWFGLSALKSNLRLLPWCVIPPAVYLSLADAVAIHLNIWSISPRQTTGISFLGLPFEEAVFFLATNIMVAQGTILFAEARSRNIKFSNELQTTKKALGGKA